MRKLLAILLLPLTLAAQPVYNATPPPSIGKGIIFTMFAAETPTPGTGTTAASQQVALSGAAQAKVGMPFAIDGKFSGAPGAFEVDVQVAATDADTNYQTISNGNITTVDATNNTFHIDCSQVVGRFMRLLVRTRTNSVTLTATVTGG